MPNILHEFPVNGTADKVFQAVATPEGLDSWWTLRCSGKPEIGHEYELWFGSGYDWRAKVSRCRPGVEFELEITRADSDWTGTRVGFRLAERDGTTQVNFHHSGWPEANQHYRISTFCWAMYLRLMKKYVEQGAVVPYEVRLEA